MIYKNRKSNYPLYETVMFDNIRTMVRNVADRFPDRNALSYRRKPSDAEAKHLTYRECADYIRDLSTALIQKGLRDRNVAIIGEASPEWILTYFSLMSMGAVSVPIDKELPAHDIASILNTAECETAFVSPAVLKKIDGIKDLAPALSTVVLMSGETADGCVPIEEMRQEGTRLVAGGNTAYFDYVIDSDKLATIVFTSGTTGKGKGVMLSQRNICEDMVNGMYNFQISYRSMVVLPPHHTLCSTVNIVGHYAEGCELYISSGLRYLVNEMKEYKPEHLILVPLFVETFYKRILATAEKTGKLRALTSLIAMSNGLRRIGIDRREKLFASVRESFGGKLGMIICGGAALNQKVIDFFDSIGITILNGYGITECSPLICANRNEYRKKGSVGLPVMHSRLKIIDPDENGEGEVAYKGSNVMLGYYKNEEATRAAIDGDGYFHTGDYGRVEEKGEEQWLYLTGRLKNLIIFSNGKNVYPEEIETDIAGVYGVNEVVVYAGESRSDPSKEIIVAEIYPDAEGLSAHGITDLQKYFDDEIKKINAKNVSYKAVGMVKLRDTEFEKNTSKKIVRFKIDKSID